MSASRQQSRRDFLRAAAASTVFPLVTVAGTKASGRVLGANDMIRVGVVGINGRGSGHIGDLLGQKDCQITYLVDVDKKVLESRSKPVRDKGGRPALVTDLRKALDDKNLDAISIATPNHWHSLMTIWACQAGKDVYVEKPISHNIFEGRQCVEAARKYGRVVQHGTQNRSSQGKANEIAAVQSGKYGRLLVSKGYGCKPRWSIGFKEPTEPPANVDFDLWLGPAQKQPFHANLVHYNWHWFWDFGNGEIGNQGVHEMDIARWAIPGATLPTKVWSLGGRIGYKDQGQTPNMQMAVMEFGDVLLVFEVRGLVGKHKDWPNKVGNEYYTTDGVITNGRFTRKGSDKSEPLGKFEARVTPGGPFGSWLTAIRSRKPEDLNANAEVAHYSAACCHLGNISYRLGEPAPFDKASGRLGENKQVGETFRNLQENYQAVGGKLEDTQLMLGKVLTFDPKTEHFTGEGAEAANAMLTRAYRAPYVVPAKV